MLRDNLAGLIKPMRAARELNPLALFTEQKKSSDDRPQDALKIPAPKGRNLTLTENAASPFHTEPRHDSFFGRKQDVPVVELKPLFAGHSDVLPEDGLHSLVIDDCRVGKGLNGLGICTLSGRLGAMDHEECMGASFSFLRAEVGKSCT